MNINLNIITAVSRPENLFAIKNNIIKEIIPFFNVKWYCIYDIGKNNDFIKHNEDWIVSMHGGIANDCAGGSQRNEALKNIKYGWNYFLDDDNIFHEGYGLFIKNKILINTHIEAFVVSQKRESGDLIAKPSYMKVGHLDIAQFLISKELIGNTIFFENIYQSDYFFIKKIYKKNKDKFMFIDKFMCNYNYLRE